MESRVESGKLLKLKQQQQNVFVYFDLEVFAAYLIPGTILGIGTLVAVSFSDEDVFKDPNDWSLGPRSPDVQGVPHCGGSIDLPRSQRTRGIHFQPLVAPERDEGIEVSSSVFRMC